jgi:hypothetical protein
MEAKNVYNLKIKRYRRSKDTFEDENMFAPPVDRDRSILDNEGKGNVK